MFTGKGGAAEKALMDVCAEGLEVAGLPLPTPHLHPVDWAAGQNFTAKDDPDRMGTPWKAPRFCANKDPATQEGRTAMEKILVPTGCSMYGRAANESMSFARVVHNVLEPAECLELIASVNEKGFTPALLNIGNGKQTLQPGLRNGHRCIVDSPELTQYLLRVLRPHIPDTIRLGGQSAPLYVEDLNERCRFLCYTPGQEFPSHCDGCYRRPADHPNAGSRSMVTVQLYLHDVPAQNGGATCFVDNRDDTKRAPCQPRAGSALLFTQDLLHEGSLVQHGLKYTMRTEVMFSANVPALGAGPAASAAFQSPPLHADPSPPV